MKLKLFSILFLVLLSSYLTRELFPRRVMDKPSISVNPVPREHLPRQIIHSFEGTTYEKELREHKGMIAKLRGELAEWKAKATTKQDLKPDTVIIYQETIPRSEILRGSIHSIIENEVFTSDVFELTDSTAILASWKRAGVKNSFEVWVRQEPGLPPARWIRFDEKRNLFDLGLLSPGYSFREGAFIDFVELRAGPLYMKGRGVSEGLGGEVRLRGLF